MVRPLGRPLARKAVTLENLREDFLAHCEARNLSERSDRRRRGRQITRGRGGATASENDIPFT
jgi:hypothetical protein